MPLTGAAHPDLAILGVRRGAVLVRHIAVHLELLLAETRLAGDDVDDTANGVGAVLDRRRAAQHLDPLDLAEIDQRRLDAGEAGRLAGVVEPLAVDQDEHPVRGQTANDRDSSERPLTLDLDAGNRLEEIGHLFGLEHFDVFAGDHRDRRGNIARQPAPGGRP